MGERPSSLVRRSLANDPVQLTLVFVGTLAGLLAFYISSDATHGDYGASTSASAVLAIAVTIIVWRVKKWRWWKRLHHLPVPLDVGSYVRALDGIADRAHLAVEITLAGTAPSIDELERLAGHNGSATVDGAVAHLVGPSVRTRNRDSRPWMQYHTNYRLDQWFRKLVNRLVPLHRQHAIQKISVTHVRDG